MAAAEEPNKSAAESQQEPAAAPPAAAAGTPKTEETFENYMKSQPNALGPVGNFLMASLLVVLCAASVLFTVGRQFQVGGPGPGLHPGWATCLVSTGSSKQLVPARKSFQV